MKTQNKKYPALVYVKVTITVRFLKIETFFPGSSPNPASVIPV
jgi:hypothetical protein